MNIYVGNIAWGVSEDELKALFAQYGEVNSARIITDRESGRSKGFGFVHETEEQVVKHLDSHLNKLSTKDIKTRAIIEQMRIDEEKHSEEALEAGAEILPDEIKDLMSKVAKVMTNSSYHI